MANIIGTTGPDEITLDSVSEGVTGGVPTDGDDTINGLAGNDLLAGGLGADTFIFAPGHGQDVIDSDIAMGTEFEPGVDKIDLSAIRQISDYQDLTGYHLSDVGDSTTIDTDDTSGGFQGQNTITLESVQNEELTADDFIFTDDPLPTVTVRNASRSEGDSGTTELVFTVNSSAPATEVITVDWAVALNGTAKADDLAPGQVLSGTVTIPVGERSAQFTVGVQGDTNAEQNDTFTVQLSNAENAVVLANNATAQGTIENDDGTPTVFSIQSELSQQEDDGVTASLDYTFDVFRLGDTSGTDTVDVLFLAGDTDADDFGGTLPPIVQTVTFEPGDKTQTVTVTIQDDFDREVDETFFLRLSNPNEGVIDTTFDTAVGTIVNDDDGPPVPTTYSIESLLTDLDEGNDGETTTWGFLIKRKGDDVSSAGQVEVVFDPGTTSADDFAGGALPESQFVSFDPGQKERLVTVEIAGDTLSELDETFILSLQNADPGSSIDPEKSSATGTIVNDDAPPTGAITGTAGDDIIIPGDVSDGVTGGEPSEADDTIDALGGNDIVSGGGGADTIEGGGGNDVLLGGAGDDTLTDSEFGNDTLAGGQGNDTLEGGKGDDTLDGGTGDDTLDGGIGLDTLRGGADNDILRGGDAADTLQGEAGDDTLEGGEGNDTLEGGADDDTLSDSSGHNTLDGGAGNDTLTGGPGVDIYRFAGDNGADRITAFGFGGDVIDLSAYGLAGLDDFVIEPQGDDTVIFGYDNPDNTRTGNTITLENVDPSRLTPRISSLMQTPM